jgi:hypothetical protein
VIGLDRSVCNSGFPCVLGGVGYICRQCGLVDAWMVVVDGSRARRFVVLVANNPLKHVRSGVSHSFRCYPSY